MSSSDSGSSDDTCSTSTRRPSRLLFASCNSQNLTQPLWPIISSRNASGFIWAGDAIYADHFAGLDFSTFPPHPIHESATPETLRRYYEQQLNHPGYKALLDTNITVFGIMDDHDYGANNGDRTYKYRRESGMAYVDFVGEPEDSPIRKRAVAGKGVYGVKLFDFARNSGEELVSDVVAGIDPDVVGKNAEITHNFSNKSVAVFVLDVRSNRTPWSKGLGAWKQSATGDMLGEEQWEWFETALHRSKAEVNVIVSGLQVHANRFPSASVAEEWVKFPRSRQRLYETILKECVKAPIIISGDVHMAQLLRKDCFKRSVDHADASALVDQPVRPLVELTTSGLTHSWGTCFASSERYHHSWYSPYFHFMSRTAMTYGHLDYICPWTELVRTESAAGETQYKPMEEDATKEPRLYENGGAERARVGKQYSLDLNFGELEFDWDNRIVSMRVMGVDGPDQPMLSAKWSFDQLTGGVQMPGSNIGSTDIAKVASQLSPDDQWVCVNYQGVAHPLHYFFGTFSGATLLFSLILLPNILSVVAVLFVVRMILRRVKSSL